MLAPLAEKNQQKREGKNKKFFTADIETASWTKFLCVGIYDGHKYEYFTKLEHFFKYIFEHHLGLDCYCHFGGIYDFLFFIQHVLSTDEYTVTDMVPRGSGILCMTIIRKKDKAEITFRDSSAFLPFSLRSLTENFDVVHKKQEIDYTKITKVTPELLEYMQYDVIGHYEVIKKYFEWPIIKKSGSAPTIAGQALKVLQTYIKRPLMGLSKRLDKEIRSSYFGGRVEIFKPVYKGKKPLYCYDVNSLYPFILRNNVFPNEFRYEVYHYAGKNTLGFYECEVDCPKMKIPFLGTVIKGKYIFPTGKFKGLYSIQEIDYARALGYKIKTGKGYIFQSGGYIFKDYIDELYKIREASPKNSVDNVIAKLLMNSCYGRFGLNSEKEKLVFDTGFNAIKPDIEIMVGKNLYRLGKEKIELDSFTNVAIASYVTSYARIYMHKEIYSKCANELYYTDTDSIFTTKKFKESNALGGLKLEYTCNEACFLLPKTYKAGKKIVMKGFDNKKIQHFHVDDFIACLEGDLKRLKITQEPRFAKIKSAVRLGAITTMTKENTRQIRSAYDKRVIIKNGGKYDTVAIHVE